MERRYKHLDAEERGVILAEHRRGSSLRQIGRLLGRHHGTIGRERVRGAAPDGYDPQAAHKARDMAERRSGRRRKLIPEARFYGWVRDRLIHWRCGGPSRSRPGHGQTVTHASRRSEPARQPCIDRQGIAKRCPERGTIHAAICAQSRGGSKALMIEALRQAKPARGGRRTTLAGSAMVPETLRIIHRPGDVEARLIPGHWEGDLIKAGGKPGGGGGKPGSNSQGQRRRRPQQGGGGRSRKAA